MKRTGRIARAPRPRRSRPRKQRYADSIIAAQPSCQLPAAQVRLEITGCARKNGVRETGVLQAWRAQHSVPKADSSTSSSDADSSDEEAEDDSEDEEGGSEGEGEGSEGESSGSRLAREELRRKQTSKASVQVPLVTTC